MPLNTEVRRNGRARKIRWGQFHVAAMTLAAALDSKEGKLYELLVEHEAPEMIDSGEYPLSPGDVFNLVGYHIIAATPLNNGSYEMKSEMTFIDVTDDEHFVLKPGDVLCMSRSW